jgi:hypothetical protein
VGGWNVRSPTTACSTCNANPDPSQTFNHTWHDTSESSASAFITFKGVSVSVYSILPPGPQIQQYLFSLNGVSSNPFVYNDTNPPQPYSYNTEIFSASSLDPQTSTTLNIGMGPGSNLLLDYIIYDTGTLCSTSASPSPTLCSASPSPTDPTPTSSLHKTSFPVAAVVVPTVVISLLLALIVYLLWRRRSDNRQFFCCVLVFDTLTSSSIWQKSPLRYPLVSALPVLEFIGDDSS